MREMGITAEQQQGGAEALGEHHPIKHRQLSPIIQGFSHQRCAQDAGFETWEPLPPGSVNSISHSVSTIDSSDKGSRLRLKGARCSPRTSPCSHGWASNHFQIPDQHQHIFPAIFPVSTRGHRHDTDETLLCPPERRRPLRSPRRREPGPGSRSGFCLQKESG